MRIIKIVCSLLLSIICCVSCAEKDTRSGESITYSDPSAPVGDTLLTQPSTTKPVIDTWMRDTYVMAGPDGYYYLTGTTATPGREFPSGRVHCWDYNDGLYLWRSKDLKNWESMGLIWSFDHDAAEMKTQSGFG